MFVWASIVCLTSWHGYARNKDNNVHRFTFREKEREKTITNMTTIKIITTKTAMKTMKTMTTMMTMTTKTMKMRDLDGGSGD